MCNADKRRLNILKWLNAKTEALRDVWGILYSMYSSTIRYTAHTHIACHTNNIIVFESCLILIELLHYMEVMMC